MDVKEKVFKALIRFIPRAFRSAALELLFPSFWRRQQSKRLVSSDGYSLAPFDQTKCIFVHIPKCAGVSLSKSLFGSLGGGHMEMWKYELIFGPQFQKYYKFTVVRNPWDRVYSAYSFLRSGGFDERDKAWFSNHIGNDVSFESFVKDFLRKKKIQKKNHFKPQCYFLKQIDGTIDLDMVIYFENIDEGVAELSREIGIDINLEPQNITKVKSSNYLDEYDDEMLKIVSEVYFEDIRQFGYKPGAI